MQESSGRKFYRLGRCCFELPDASPVLEKTVSSLLHEVKFSEDQKVERIYGIEGFRDLQNHIYKLHKDCLWLDASCLLSPNGKTVLIVGRSGAGKSTIAMALAYGYEWKVVAEDILLIDTETNELLTFGAPFSLKTGTLELLEKTVGFKPAVVIEDQWAPMGDHSAPWINDARIDFAYFFQSLNYTQILQTNLLRHSEFVLKCMPYSNILRRPELVKKLTEYVSGSSSFSLYEGSLRDRLDFLLSQDV